MAKLWSTTFSLLIVMLITFNARGSSIFYPAPPPDAKIQLVDTFAGEEDFEGSSRPWWKNVLNLVLGLQEEYRLVGPYGVGGDSERLFITDPGARIVWLVDHEKDALYSWTSVEEVEELTQPVDVVVGPEGRVFVSDSTAKKVFVFDENAELVDEIVGFERPTGLAVDNPNKLLFVSDTVAHVIKVFDLADFKQIMVIGERGDEAGTFNFPVHLEFADGNLYVIDSMNFRVQVFNSNGEYVSSFGRLGDGLGDFSRPKGISVDSDGHVYVVDGLMDKVQIFNREGKLLLPFGQTGNEPGQFWLASDIFIDENDRIYVADTYNHRVQVFQYLGE